MSNMTPHELWQAALGELELTIPKTNFTAWFKSTSVSSYETGKVIICVPNAFTKLYIEKKYHSAVLKALQNIVNAPIREVIYKVDSRPQTAQPTGTTMVDRSALAAETADVAPVVAQKDGVDEFGLRRSYTFSTFIVGKGNELAHAAAQAVADEPGKKYNPFFIYGGVGLGKTHLLQAIGHRIVERNPKIRVLYVTCEQFVNEFISAIRSQNTKSLKDRYRTVDLLLIDDIQFITGKEGTQEEFFHTFNTLHQAEKQVVFTSDRPPKAIAGLEERLRSRLEWGMIADVSSPDLETRVAILTSKCQERHIHLSRDILSTIADLVVTNVRELEGALNKVVAYHEFKNISPTTETVREALAGYSQTQLKKTISPKHLISSVASYFDLQVDDLLGKSREKKLAFPRQISMYLMRMELHSSFPTIGDELGGRDHTTAMHACGKVEKELEKDEKLRMDLEAIKERLYATIQ